MEIVSTLCLADKSFQQQFKWEELISRIIRFCNKKLQKAGVQLEAEIKSWPYDVENADHGLHLLGEETSHSQRVVGFTDNYLSPSSGLAGIAFPDKGLALVGRFFPISVPFWYKYGLCKLALHEIGHTFGLEDTSGEAWSIMDYRYGLFTSSFNKQQVEIMRKKEWI